MSTGSEALPRLGAKLFADMGSRTNGQGSTSPETVLQFGGGKFIRGFVDWMIDGMNEKSLFKGRAVVVGRSFVPELNAQDGLYTLVVRGAQNGRIVEQQSVIRSISRGIDPNTDFQSYLQCAHNPELRWIFSNTTEAGIAYSADDRLSDQPPRSFPGKLTALLLERYRAFDGDVKKGFVILPCELIDRNGDTLKKTVLQTAANWDLGSEFEDWLNRANTFANTLVDRIVTGAPAQEAQELCARAGYQDDLFVCAEPFHLWVIECPEHVAAELPLHKAGFNVVFTNDLSPYRERKVRILNGAHTGSALAAYLAGKNYVGEIMKDPLLFGFMKRAIYDEVIPTLSLPKEELEKFAEDVFERFSNPFLQHELLSISLNSVSKYKARVLPSLERYAAMTGSIPRRLALGLAALIVFYRGAEIRGTSLIGLRNGQGYKITDDLAILSAFSELWSRCDGSPASVYELTDAVLRHADWWGKDLTEIGGLLAAVTQFVTSILRNGMVATMTQLESGTVSF